MPAVLKPAYVHRQSRDLAEILRLLLLGSNNYIANQVFLEIGADLLGGPVSLDKSLRVANQILAKHGLAKAIHLEEGSGISRDNRFTARGLAEVLDLFAPHAQLMRRTKSGSRYKTGTFSGVRTLAGLAKTKSHGDVRFVISLSGGGKTAFSPAGSDRARAVTKPAPGHASLQAAFCCATRSVLPSLSKRCRTSEAAVRSTLSPRLTLASPASLAMIGSSCPCMRT